jgi:2-polyprenyl-3-methyl-5-hydroxy-6-metoxy-1,4-benzoquinol methylase
MGNRSFTPESLRELAYAFQASRVFLTAYELGIFTTLGSQGRSSEEVAASRGTDARATDRLMNALVGMGVLLKEGGTFRNSPSAARYLVSSAPEYMSGLMHTVHLWDTWTTLTDTVREGSSVPDLVPKHAAPPDWTDAFIAAMHYRAQRQASFVATHAAPSAGSKVLDVGGGSGAFSAALVRAGENVTATVFDLPGVLPLTRRYMREEGLLDRMAFVAGNYLTDELPTGFHLVLLSAIVHSNSPAQNRDLVRKCSGALLPHGRLLVQDFIMSDDRIQPAHGAFFALNMLVGTDGGDTYTEPEIRGWMSEAGLSGITRTDTPYGTGLITGTKPA